MKLITLIVALFAVFLSQVAAAPAAVAKPLLPTEDEFYQPTDNYESAQPGEVLKFRLAPGPLRSAYYKMNVKNAYQYMYRTTSALGNPSYAVGMLIEPYNANNSRMLQYSMAEDSSSKNCGASYTFLYGASFSTIVGQLEGLFFQAGLNEGWWVNTADYEGPNAAFTAGRMAAHGVLDSVRAAKTLQDKTGLDSEAEVAFWGYSGGALATTWATALQPSYAPELSKYLLGAAVGGVPANITKTILAVDGTVYSGLIVAGMYGLSQEYPILQPVVTSVFPKRMSWMLSKARDSCIALAAASTAYTQFFTGPHKLVVDGLAIFSRDDVKEVLRNTTLGIDPTEMPQIPIFLYAGTKDAIVPEASTEFIYEQWCANDIRSFEVALSLSTRHITEMVFGAPAAFTWLKDRFEHKDNLVKGCSKTLRKLNLLYPGITRNTLDFFEGAAKTIFGFKVGPSSASVASNTTKREEFDYDFDYDDIVERDLNEQFRKEKRSLTSLLNEEEEF